MSREELKTAINELLDNIPDPVLGDVLNYLRSVKDQSPDTIALSQNLRTILIEDQELLERLAK